MNKITSLQNSLVKELHLIRERKDQREAHQSVVLHGHKLFLEFSTHPLLKKTIKTILVSPQMSSFIIVLYFIYFFIIICSLFIELDVYLLN